MIDIREQENQKGGFTPPEGDRVLSAPQALALLQFSKQALYKFVEVGRIPAFYWGNGFTKLYPRNPDLPIDELSSSNLVFLESTIKEYLKNHPVVGKGLEYQFHGEELEETVKAGQDMINKQGFVVIKDLFALVRKHYGKNNTVALPAIMRLIDEHGWPLPTWEQEAIDDLLREGRRILEEQGTVKRKLLSLYMYERHQWDNRHYPIIAYVANREGWPMPPALEKYAQKRRDGRVIRHKPHPQQAAKTNFE